MSARANLTPSVSSADSSSSEPTTSREVLENVYHLEQAEADQRDRPADKSDVSREPSSTSISSPTTSELSNSRSTADVPSEVLASPRTAAASLPGPERVASAASGQIHGHLLPSGWACNYYPTTDEYHFEYSQRDEQQQQQQQHQGPSGPREERRAQCERGINVRTPTRDDTAQTSRRPTLLQFECQYGYHFPTSPTASMISELAKQVQRTSTATGPGTQPSVPRTRQVGYGVHKLTLPTDEDEQARRLRDMFPTATAPVVEQMIRIYHGREGLIKAALISLGYKRSTEYGTQQATAQSPIMLMMSKPASRKLFDKLVSYFPDKDESLIKSLMYKHKEVEHEIISALVEESFHQDSSTTTTRGMSRHAPGGTHASQIESALRLERSGAIMKLRYLKFLYPTCEEIELYHLLNCNDLNAQRVMEIVEQQRGHKRANIEEVLASRKSQTQQMRAQQTAHAAKEKACSQAAELVQAHVGRPKPSVAQARVANLKASLMKTVQQQQHQQQHDLDEGLVLGALEAADYNEPLARRFLEERAPVDEARYKQRYEICAKERAPNTVAFPCKAVQKNTSDTNNFMSIVANESLHIAREVIECQHALALLKCDAATFTGDDFPHERRESLARGRQLELQRGPSLARQRHMKLRDSLQVGPNVKLQSGTQYELVKANAERTPPGTRASGRNSALVRGRNAALRCGHNAKLLERTHPFFSSPSKAA